MVLDNTNWPVFMKKEDCMTIEIALLVMDYFFHENSELQRTARSKASPNFCWIVSYVIVPHSFIWAESQVKS